MVDTPNTKTNIQTAFADNTTGAITPQSLRNGFETLFGCSPISVLQYGAVGNGSTDDLTAINNALAAAGVAGGGQVIVPPGKTYNYSGVITIPAKVRLSGYGATFAATSVTNMALQVTGNGVTIEGITLTSSATVRQTTPQSARIWAKDVTNFIVRDIVISGSGSAGILMDNVTDGFITGNTISNTLADSIMSTGSTANCKRITTTNNHIINSGDDCISVVGYSGATTSIWPPEDIVISNNTILGGLARGITVVGGQKVTITGNNIRDVVFSGIYIACEQPATNATTGVQDCTITGNLVKGCGGGGYSPVTMVGLPGSLTMTNPAGTLSNGVEHIIFSGNMLTQNRSTKENIYINENCRHLQLSGNSIHDGGTVGISLHSGDTMINNNWISDVGGTGILVGTEATILGVVVIDGNRILRPNTANGGGTSGINVQNATGMPYCLITNNTLTVGNALSSTIVCGKAAGTFTIKDNLVNTTFT